MERHLSKLFAALSVFLSIATLYLCFSAPGVPARVLLYPVDADTRSEQFLTSIAQGNLAAVGSMLVGSPALETNPAFSSEYNTLLWEAYCASITYTFQESCQPDSAGVCRRVTVSALDLSMVTNALSLRYDTLLAEKQTASSSPSFLYDENDPQRNAFLMNVLQEALRQVLEENDFTVNHDLLLKMVLQDGQWQILPDSALMALLSGK